MTVGELIEKLGAFDKDLPVALEDWAEEYLPPSVLACKNVRLDMAEDVTYRGTLVSVSAVVIGG